MLTCPVGLPGQILMVCLPQASAFPGSRASTKSLDFLSSKTWGTAAVILRLANMFQSLLKLGSCMKKCCLLFCLGEKSFLLGFPFGKSGCLFWELLECLVGSWQDRLSLASVTRLCREMDSTGSSAG